MESGLGLGGFTGSETLFGIRIILNPLRQVEVYQSCGIDDAEDAFDGPPNDPTI